MSERDFYSFLASEFADADFDGLSDADVVRRCATPHAAEWLRAALAGGRATLDEEPFPWRKIADQANRNLAGEDAVRQWLGAILDLLAQQLDRLDPPSGSATP
jgi:hypothetical protein